MNFFHSPVPLAASLCEVLRWSGLSHFYYGNYECPFFSKKYSANFQKNWEKKGPSPMLSFPPLLSLLKHFFREAAGKGSLLQEWLQRVQTAWLPSAVCARLVHWRQIGHQGQLQGSWGLCLLATLAFSAASLFRKPSVQEVCECAQKHLCAVWSLWFGLFFLSVTFSPLAGE